MEGGKQPMANFDTSVATTDTTTTTTTTPIPACSISECVQRALANYFSQLGDQPPSGLYEMVLSEVERPLIEAMMTYTRGNQSKAAIYLGISRGTLRKKLKIYNLE